VGDVSTTITVNAPGAAAEVNSIAEAFERLDVAADRAKEALDGIGTGAAGLGGLAGELDAAAAQAETAAGRIDAALKGIGDGGGGGLAGISGQLKGLDEVADSAAGSLAATGDALKEVDAAGAGAGASLGAAADKAKTLGEGLDAVKGGGDSAAEGLKATGAAAADTRDTIAGLTEGIGASTDALKTQRDFMASYTADMKAMTAVMAETTAVSASASDMHDYASAVQAAGEATDGVTASQVYGATMARNAAVQQKSAQEDAAASAEASAGKYHMLALGIAGAVGYGTYLAAQLQTGTNRLYTSAGESQANLPLISKGILALSGQTDTSQANLMTGAYWDESAGFHGQDALAVLKSGAQGAYMEGADIGTTENALTTELNDYFGGPRKSAATQQQQANAAMNAIITSVGLGKMTLQGISSAMPVLLPTAHAAGLTLPQILGAESTMTSQGMSAQDSAQDIKYAITHTQKPSNVQTAEMQMLGINPLQVESSLPKQGLTGLIKEYDSAIASHTNKSGQVVLDVMNQSKLAMDSAQAAITKLPESVQGVAREYLSGKLGQAQWYDLTSPSKSTLPALDVARLKQFGTIADSALGFSSMIKSGQGDKQTATAALNELMGGAPGQTVGQYLGGTQNLKTFNDDVTTIGQSVSHTGANVKGWNVAQDSLNFKLGSFVKSLEAVATEAGQVALPGLTRIAGGASDVLGFAASHQALTQDALIGGGILALPAILSKVASPIQTLAASAGKVGQVLNIPGADKLANLGKDAGATAGTSAATGGLDQVGTAATGAAGALDRLGGAADRATSGENAAGAAGGKEAAGETAGGAGGIIPAAAAEKTAAEGEGLGEDAAELGGGALGLGAIARMLPAAMSDIASNANPIGMGISAALFARGVGDHLAPKGTMAGAMNQVSQHTVNPDADAVNYIAGGFLAKAMTSSALAPQHSGMGQGSVADARLGILPPAQAAQGPVTAAQAYGESAIAPPRALPASTKAALDSDVKLKVSIDDAALGAAKAHITSMLASLSGGQVKPVKIPEPDLSAVEGAKSKVAADMGAITGEMKSGAGAAGAAGAAVSSGFAVGILAGEGAAVSAARQVAGAAAAAMATQVQARSPSKVTEKTGKDTGDGYTLGLASTTNEAAAAGTKVASAATEALKAKTAAATPIIAASAVKGLVQGLQGGASEISAAQALVTGVAAPYKDSTIASTLTTLDSDVAKALKDRKIDSAEASGLDKYLAADNTRLQKLAGQRAQLESQIQAANAFGQATTASANQSANIMTIAGGIQSADTSTSAPAPAPTYQASDLISGLQGQVQQTKQFTGELADLKRAGLNKAEISQIASAGAAAGIPVAQAILAGGPSSVKELNKLTAEENEAAKALGKTAEGAAYDPSKLKGQLKGVDESMKAIATQEVNALKSALSGSAAAADFSGIGAKIIAEIAAGIDGAAGQLAADVAAAAKKKGKTGGDDTATAHSGAVSHPATAAGGASSGSSAGHYGGGSPPVQSSHTANITVMLDSAVVGRSTQSWLLSHGSQNQQTGVVPKGQNKTA
jgi:hypothetical protein